MEHDKTLLLNLCKMITNAGFRTIECLRTNTMSNLKLIDRSSRCVKDPNPLASTMSIISTKYPISVDKEIVIKSGVPNKYYYKNHSIQDDTHYHGRVLCKKEAVDWWITNSTIPDEDTIESISILTASTKKDVSLYNSINWSESRIQWGPPNLERRRISTKNPLAKVDPTIREQVIMQTLMPDHTLPHSRVTKDDLTSIKGLADLSLPSKMSLSAQLRILLNQLDPKKRMLPVIPGCSDIIGPIKHALVHNNFVLNNITSVELSNVDNTYLIIDKFGKNLQYKFTHSSLDQGGARKIIHESTLYGKSISSYLRDPDMPDTNYTKWLKVILGLAINSESESNNLRTSPAAAKIKIFRVENLSGTKFMIYEGTEIVNFRFIDMRGRELVF